MRGCGEPALVLVHTTAGLGNSVGGIATARVNRAPLVVIVGQQDRRHLVLEPFLAGRLRGLAGEYPVWAEEPVRAQDVPGAIDRAYHEAATARGPAIVVVPMDDWLQEADTEREDASAGRVPRTRAVDDATVDELASFLADAESPALVVGAGADDAETWEALVALAERLVAPVFQESFGAGLASRRTTRSSPASFRPTGRACVSGSPRTTPCSSSERARFASRPGARWAGSPSPGRTLALVSDYRVEVHRSPVELAVLAPPGPVARPLAERPRAARRPAAAAFPATAATRSPRTRRPADGEPRACRTRRAPAKGRRRPRGSPGRPARDPRPASRPSAARLCQRRDGRAGFRRAGRSWAPHGASEPTRRRGDRGRLVALRDPGTVERCALPRRRALRDPPERRLRDHGPARRALPHRRPVARLRRHRDRSARPRVRLPGSAA